MNKKATTKMWFLLLTVLAVLLMSTVVFAVTPGTNLGSAGLVQLGPTYAGKVRNSREDNYFKFVVTTPSVIKVHVETASHKDHVAFNILNSEGKNKLKVVGATSDPNNWGYQKTDVTFSLRSGIHYIRFYCLRGASYSFSVNVLEKESASIKIAGPENNYVNKAVSFSPGNKLAGVAENGFNGMDWDPSHYYKFSVSRKGTFKLGASVSFLDTGSSQIWIDLHNSNGQYIKQLLAVNGNKNGNPYSSSTALSLNTGTYYLSITSPDQHVRYRLSTSFTATFTGLKMNGNRLTYYKNGKIDTTKTGIVKYNSKWYYLEKGVFSAKTGICKRADEKGNWFYVEKGIYRTSKTGLTKRVDGKGNWYYVVNGVFGNAASRKTGIAKRIDNKGGWYYVVKGVYGKADSKKTGIVKRADGVGSWFYIKNGVYDTSKTGIARKADGSSKTYFYVVNGVYKKTFTGKIWEPAYRKYFYIKKGVMVKAVS